MSAFSEEKIAIPLASYSGASSILSLSNVRSGKAKGAFMTLYAKTAGTSNLLFRLSAIPFAGSSYVPQVQVTITMSGTYVIVWGPGVSFQPPGEAADTVSTVIAKVVSIPLPDNWRFSIGKGDTSAWEFGVSYRLIG